MAPTKKASIKYSVVRYLHDNQVTSIPETWVEKKKDEEGREIVYGAWPEGTNDYSISEFIARKSKKQKSWPTFKIQILGTASSLLEARAKEKIASDDSCTDVDAEYVKQEVEHKKTLGAKSKKRDRRRKRDEDFEYENADSCSSEDSSEKDEDEQPSSELVPNPPSEDIFQTAVKLAVDPCKDGHDDALLKDQQDNVPLEVHQDDALLKIQQMKSEKQEDQTRVQSNQLPATAEPSTSKQPIVEPSKQGNDLDDIEFEPQSDSSNDENETLNMRLQKNASLNDKKDDPSIPPGSGWKDGFPEDDNMWHIVKFVKSTKRTVIPSIWLNIDGVSSQWPPDCTSKSDITKYIMSRKIPDEDWKTRSVKEKCGVVGVYAEGLERINILEPPLKRIDIEVNESIGERGSEKKVLAELSASDLNLMSERDLLSCTITGFQEVVHGQQQLIHEIRMNKSLGASTSTAQPTSAGYQHENLRDHFPASTLRKFKDNEERLNDDPAYRTAVASFMADVGGENGHKSCQKMLAKAMTDNVAKRYCMQGHSNNKMAFNVTAIWNVIKDVVVQNFKNHSENKYSFAAAENTCSLWLRQADHRLDRKIKKTNGKKRLSIDDMIALEEAG